MEKTCEGMCASPYGSMEHSFLCLWLRYFGSNQILNIPDDRLHLWSWKTNLENNKFHFKVFPYVQPLFFFSSLGSINLIVLAFFPLFLKYLCFLDNICTLQIFIDFLVFPQSLAKSCMFSTFNLLDSFHKSMLTLLASFLPLCLFDLYLSDSEVFESEFIYSIASVTITVKILVKILLSHLTSKPALDSSCKIS